MAIQFLNPQQSQWTDLGQILGLGLGGIGGAIGSYAAHEAGIPGKIKKFEAFGATPEQSKALANSSEAVQAAWLKEAMKMQRLAQEDLATTSLLPGGARQPITPSPEQTPTGINTLQALGGPQKQIPQQQEPDMNQLMNQMTTDQLIQWRDNMLRKPGDPRLKKQASDILQQQIDTKMKQESSSSKERSEAFKVTAPYRKVMAEKQESRAHLADTLKEMAKLEASGKMTDATWLQFLEMFGLDFNILKSPETEAYQALEKEFLRDLKSIFGGRISNQEMQTFLRSIPRASNTPEGRKLIRERLEALYKAQSSEYKIMRKIISENNGIPPLDLQEQVLDRSQEEKHKKQQEKYANQFMGIPKGAHIVVNEKTGERGYEMPDGKMYTLEEL